MGLNMSTALSGTSIYQHNGPTSTRNPYEDSTWEDDAPDQEPDNNTPITTTTVTWDM
jgi:hypothetical protein